MKSIINIIFYLWEKKFVTEKEIETPILSEHPVIQILSSKSRRMYTAEIPLISIITLSRSNYTLFLSLYNNFSLESIVYNSIKFNYSFLPLKYVLLNPYNLFQRNKFLYFYSSKSKSYFMNLCFFIASSILFSLDKSYELLKFIWWNKFPITKVFLYIYRVFTNFWMFLINTSEWIVYVFANTSSESEIIFHLILKKGQLWWFFVFHH